MRKYKQMEEKKNPKHPCSEQAKNLLWLSNLPCIDLAPPRSPEPPSSACHPGPAAEMTGPFIYGTEANDARGEAGDGEHAVSHGLPTTQVLPHGAVCSTRGVQ